MQSLFVDLYRYRQRENKNNLEDWLTECMAAVLRSLPRASLIEMLADLCACGPDALAAALGDRTVQVETQWSTENSGRPDMVILADGEPWIVFENKVAAGIGKGGEEEGAGGCQVRRYADWLAPRAAPKLPATVVFLTHLTLPPAGFCDSRHPRDGYHGFVRPVLTWGPFARRLRQVAAREGEASLALGLAEALYGMLEEHTMTDDYPTSRDLAALELFLSFGAATENLVDRMWSAVHPAFDFGSNGQYVTRPVFRQGTYSAWRYVRATGLIPVNSFLETGIWFAGMTDWYTADDLKDCPQFPAGAQVFVLLGNDDDDRFTKVPGAPTGWLRTAGSDFMAFAPLASFGSDPDQRGKAILEWARTQAAALREFHGLFPA